MCFIFTWSNKLTDIQFFEVHHKQQCAFGPISKSSFMFERTSYTQSVFVPCSFIFEVFVLFLSYVALLYKWADSLEE